jgi:class 3 adenylate cyclase
MPETNQLPSSQRKNATILFADLSGFTAMSANLDPEEVRDVVNRYFEALAAAVRRYEGSIDKYIGDCVMAVFGVPATHENDAERACRAALDMLSAVRDLASTFGSGSQPPDIHIGVNTGLVVAAPMGSGDSAQFTVMGDAVNLASRLCHEAENGQIALGESTWTLVEHDFDFAPKELRSIKGKGEKVPVFFLRGRSQKTVRERKRSQPALVGRSQEISLAQNLLAQARNKQAALLYVTGDPGIGKSRFSSEISQWASANGYQVLDASAQPLSAIEPYSLWRQLLERHLGIVPGMAPAEASTLFDRIMQSKGVTPEQTISLRATLGLPTSEFELLDDEGRSATISRGWTAFLRRLEAEKPVLLILDDLQWADALSLRLLDQVIDFVPGHAMVLCCLARPEFQHTWTSRSCFHGIALRPLSAEECMALAKALMKDGAGFNQAEAVARADGNPFYLTELSQAAIQNGAGKLPATIEAMILERIDRLERQSRQVLELASVIGREFPDRLLRALANPKHLDSQLPRLSELEFIYEKEVAPELLYLFKHYLTQEATYNSILIQRRKEMHGQVAAAIEQIYKDSLDRYYSVLAQHYEKAADFRRAFECFRLAGDQAQGTTSDSAAVQFYERSESALQMMHEDRPTLRNKWKAFLIIGGIGALSLALGYALERLLPPAHGGHRSSDWSWGYLLGGMMGFVVGLGLLAFWSKRWSFLVYPDRIRIRSKRRAVDIPFEGITGVRVISYQHRPTPGVLWTELKIYYDPRYSKFGMGQMQVLRGVREIIRIECAHHKWRKGYYLDMEEPRPFLQTLERALNRYRSIRSSKVASAPR